MKRLQVMYGRFLQAQQIGGRVLLIAAPAPAATVHDDGGGHHTTPLILIVVIVVGIFVFLAALLFKEAKSHGPSKESHKLDQKTRSNIHLIAKDCSSTLNRKAASLPFASKIQSKLSTLAPLGQETNVKKNNHHQVYDNHVSLDSDPRKLTTLQQGWPTFNMDQLLKSSAQPLFGMGVFGTAYKVTHNGLPNVVIRHLKDVSIGHQEFRDRIGDLAKLNHVNILPIVAYYFSEKEKILLYEYLNNGNLSTHLHGKGKEGWSPLEWPRRMQIAMDVAQGIAYIHGKGKNNGLFHGNIKPANVLLGSKYKACLTDTGLMHLVCACPATLNVGYRAPEVAHMNRPLTHKSDVYSYGVLLLELLTGKEVMCPTSNKVLDLPHFIHSSIHEEWTTEIFDPSIPLQSKYEEEMVLMLKIAMECIQRAPRDRPSMAKVVGMIKTMRKFDTPSGSAYTDISTPNDPLDFV